MVVLVGEQGVLKSSLKLNRRLYLNIDGWEMTKNKKVLLPVALALIAVALFAVFWGVTFYSGSNLSTSDIRPVNSDYLTYSSGNVSKIFLVSAEPRYGYWTQNDTHMDWFTNGPVIHKGDQVFVVNATIRNDYTQNDQYRVGSDNRSHVVLTVKLYDKDNHVIIALQAYPRVDTKFNGSVFAFESGKTTSFELYLATGNRNIDHYEIFVEVVASVPPP